MGKVFLALAVSLGVSAFPAMALDQLSALARVVSPGIQTQDHGGRTELNIAVSQPVPWRVFTLDTPRRLVLDFNELAWEGAETDNQSGYFAEIRTGRFQQGWTRMVVMLTDPIAVSSAQLRTGQSGEPSLLTVTLEPVSAEVFSADAGPPANVIRQRPEPVFTAQPGQRQGARPVIILDPGHGGIDPGAQAGDVKEADLVLSFARNLKEALLRTGQFDVALTRNEDIFVPLETRTAMAHEVGADAFVSLHADSLAEGTGSASGATVYTLSEDASDEASRALAERHDRSDLLAGVDLGEGGDDIALILMDLARTETAPRSDRLGDAIIDEFREADIKVNSKPRREAAFSVLKSADIPSVLVELGFLSSARDLKRLRDDEWRIQASEAMVEALSQWFLEDEALSALMRQ